MTGSLTPLHRLSSSGAYWYRRRGTGVLSVITCHYHAEDSWLGVADGDTAHCRRVVES
jgi:hypothetical protein